MCNSKSLLLLGAVGAIAATGGLAAGAFAPATGGIMAGMGGSVAMGIGSTLMASGQMKQGEIAKDVADVNAERGRIQAKETLKEGVIAADKVGAQVRQAQGTMNAQNGALGIDGGTGTASQRADQLATMGATDVEQTWQNYRKKAWGYEVGAQDTQLQGEMAQQSARLSGYGTLMSGAAAIRSRGIYRS